MIGSLRPGADGDLLVAGRRVQPGLLRVLAPDGTRHQLEPKAMAVLLRLAEAAGEVVSRERLIHDVWEGGFVTDDVLTRAIGQLRKVFGDDPEQPAVIETIRKRGYRLLVPASRAVEPAEAALSPPAPSPTAPSPPAPSPPAPSPTAPSPTAPSPTAPSPTAPSPTAPSPTAPSPTAPSSVAPSPGASSSSASASPPAPSPAAPAPVAPTPPAGATALGPAATAPAALAGTGAVARRRRRRLAAGALAAATAALLGAAFLGRRVTYPPGPAGTPRLVPIATGFPGEIRRPVLSPDGTRVAFAAEDRPGAGFSIEVVLLEGGNPLRLSSAPAGTFDLPAAWSPDGGELAYVRSGGGACEVRIVPALGGPDRRFAPCGDGVEPSVAWSPDGSFLVQSVRPASGPRRLRREALDGRSAARDLTRPPDEIWGDSGPAFSPDGQSIAFVRSLAPDVDDLWVMPAAGGTERRVTFDHAMVIGIDWLADGHTLVFSSSRAGINSLWAVDAAGGGTPRLLAGAGPKIKHPKAARSSSRVVFESWELEINLRRASAASGRQLPVAAGPDWSWSPRYSPDGRRAVFLSTRSGSPEIWTAELPDGPAQRLTSFGGPQLASPSWSPDGERLVFVARPQGEADLYLIEARGGPPRRLTSLPGDELEPSFSHDGRFVYFASRRRGGAWQIERVETAGGAIEQVTRDGGYTAQESADGSALFFTHADRPGLFRLPLPLNPGSPAEPVAPDVRPAKAQAWEAGPAGVFLDLQSGDEHRVVRLGKDGSRSPVTPLPDLAWNGFSVRRDGAEVLYAHTDRHACRFVLLDRPRVD
jgi:Tol biopolymer transport system component/DNA-binding winged helix-turn-helix (wHTH) protein